MIAKFEKEFREAMPNAIGETDAHFDLDNYKDWLEEELTATREKFQDLSEQPEAKGEMPLPEKYGWHTQNGFDDEPSGWMIEGGEQAYSEALKEWQNKQAKPICEVTGNHADWNYVMSVYSKIGYHWFNIPDYKKKSFEGTSTYRAIQNRIILRELDSAIKLCAEYERKYLNPSTH